MTRTWFVRGAAAAAAVALLGLKPVDAPVAATLRAGAARVSITPAPDPPCR